MNRGSQADRAAGDGLSVWERDCEPGVAVGVSIGGEIVFADGFGDASAEHGVPITPRTSFTSHR